MTEVIDFRTKRMLANHRRKQKIKEKINNCDWVSDELVKVINEHIKRKTHSFDIACALADVSVQFIHDTAPSTASAQHILLTAMKDHMEIQMHEEYEDE